MKKIIKTICATALLVLQISCASNNIVADNKNELSIKVLSDCSDLPKSSKIFSLYANGNSEGLVSWNHIKNPNNRLSLSPNDYDINYKINSDNNCAGDKYFNAILLKKTVDWNQQHSNGIEKINIKNIKFGDVKNFIIDIKINSKNTKIPSVESLSQKYQAYVTKEQIESFDNGLLNIGFNFYEKNRAPQKENDRQNFYILTLDQNKYADKWLRVTIPFDDFSYYIVNEYVKDFKSRTELNNVPLNGFLMVGETKTAATLRTLIANSFVRDHPDENFKEMDVSVRFMGFELY